MWIFSSLGSSDEGDDIEYALMEDFERGAACQIQLCSVGPMVLHVYIAIDLIKPSWYVGVRENRKLTQ